MIEVQLTAKDAKGNTLAFTLGMGRSYDSAKHAANVGMVARLQRDESIAANVRTFTVERI
jgi:hypothetical protein